jgi:hypothetical protein
MIRSKSVSLFEESVTLVRVRVMALNATFNNISVISWRLVLLVEETGVSGENYRRAVSRCQTLSHNVVSTRRVFGHLEPGRTLRTGSDK